MVSRSVRRRRTIAGLVLCAVLAALAGIAVGSGDGQGPLRWQGDPRSTELAGSGGTSLLSGRVVNASDDVVRLRAADVHALDVDGDELPGRAAFATGYVPEVLLRGLGDDFSAVVGRPVGRSVVLRPRQSAPLLVAYDGRAEAIRYEGGELPLRP
jgi:hypothetical protein